MVQKCATSTNQIEQALHTKPQPIANITHQPITRAYPSCIQPNNLPLHHLPFQIQPSSINPSGEIFLINPALCLYHGSTKGPTFPLLSSPLPPPPPSADPHFHYVFSTRPIDSPASANCAISKCGLGEALRPRLMLNSTASYCGTFSHHMFLSPILSILRY